MAQTETISLPDSEGDVNEFADIQDIDAEIVDHGILEEENDEEILSSVHNSEENSVITLNTLDINTKLLSIRIVDCVKYPQYYGMYLTQIIDRINANDKQKEDTLPAIDKSVDVINDLTSPIIRSDSHSTENVSCHNDLFINDRESLKSSKEIKKLHREDLEILKAIQQKHREEIDLKKNKGLIGMRIKQKILNKPTHLENNACKVLKKKPKKRNKCKEVQLSRVINNIDVTLLSKDTTQALVLDANIIQEEKNQKATKEDLKSTAENIEQIEQAIPNVSEDELLKNSIGLVNKNQIDSYFNDTKKAKQDAIEKQQGIYDSIELTRQRIVDRMKINTSVNKERKKSPTNCESKHYKKSNKGSKISFNQISSHLPKLESKKILADTQNDGKTKTNGEVTNQNRKLSSHKPNMDSSQKDSPFHNFNVSSPSFLNTNRINEKNFMTINERQKNHIAIPNVIKDCSKPEAKVKQYLPFTIGEQISTKTAMTMRDANSNHNVSLFTETIPSDISNFIHNNNIKRDYNKKNDTSKKISYQTKHILISDETSPVTDKMNTFQYGNRSEVQNTSDTNNQTLSQNYSTVINENSYKATNQNILSFKQNEKQMNILVNELKQKMTKMNLKRKQNLSIRSKQSRFNDCNIDDYLKMKVFNIQSKVPENQGFPENKHPIDTIITDRNFQNGNIKSQCPGAVALNDYTPREAQLSAILPRSANKVVNSMNKTAPMESPHPRPDFQANIIRPTIQPPFVSLPPVRHQMPLQHQSPVRYAFQHNYRPNRMPGETIQNLSVSRSDTHNDAHNSMQSVFSGWNVHRVSNDGVNIPPGICDVHPNVNFAYPPPPVPPPPPPTPLPQQVVNDSIIGRNLEGIVKKINLTQSSKLRSEDADSKKETKLHIVYAASTPPIISKKDMMDELQKVGIENPKGDLKRIQKSNLEDIKYKPGPLSKKLKVHKLPKANYDWIPPPGKEYSSPVLPIPTYDIILSGISKPATKEGVKGTIEKIEKLKNRLAQLKKDVNVKKISLAEYKTRALLYSQNGNKNNEENPKGNLNTSLKRFHIN